MQGRRADHHREGILTGAHNSWQKYAMTGDGAHARLRALLQGCDGDLTAAEPGMRSNSGAHAGNSGNASLIAIRLSTRT
jgi:hypothetical protein